MRPVQMIAPTTTIPRAKEPASPAMPIPMGMAPAPKRNAMGMERETAKFRVAGGPMRAKAAKPAGKKETAKAGCRKMTTINQYPWAMPSMSVVRPVSKKIPLKVRLGPNRSTAHPAMKAMPSPEILEMAISVLAWIS